jgi:hypothetical protein
MAEEALAPQLVARGGAPLLLQLQLRGRQAGCDAVEGCQSAVEFQAHPPAVAMAVVVSVVTGRPGMMLARRVLPCGHSRAWHDMHRLHTCAA